MNTQKSFEQAYLTEGALRVGIAGGVKLRGRYYGAELTVMKHREGVSMALTGHNAALDTPVTKDIEKVLYPLLRAGVYTFILTEGAQAKSDTANKLAKDHVLKAAGLGHYKLLLVKVLSPAPLIEDAEDKLYSAGHEAIINRPSTKVYLDEDFKNSLNTLYAEGFESVVATVHDAEYLLKRQYQEPVEIVDIIEDETRYNEAKGLLVKRPGGKPFAVNRGIAKHDRSELFNRRTDYQGKKALITHEGETCRGKLRNPSVRHLNYRVW